MRSIILISGGIDSVVLAHHLAAEGHALRGIFVRYGQRAADREQAAARRTMKRLHGDLTTVTFGGALGHGVLLGHGDLAEDDAAVVPARNLLLVASALSHALATNVPEVYIGVTAGDREAYADCRQTFYLALDGPVSHLGATTIRRPFVTKTKAEVVAKGADMGVPWSDAYSCYAGKAIPCRQCRSCKDRELAFTEAGVKDVEHGHKYPTFTQLVRS